MTFRDSLNQILLRDLHSKGIDIHAPLYKKSAHYTQFKKDNQIFDTIDGWISIETYIERYLLTKKEVSLTYDSRYDMGNTIELSDEDCQDIALAKDIITKIDLKCNEGCRLDEEDFAERFYREKGGIVDRLRRALDFDIESFDCKNNLRYKSEICKIIYFIYILENRDIPKILGGKYYNVLELLSKPSMENIDNSLLGWTTSNGLIIKTIKTMIEKELSVLNSQMAERRAQGNQFKKNRKDGIISIEEIRADEQCSVVLDRDMKAAISDISSMWTCMLDAVHFMMTYRVAYNQRLDVERIIEKFSSCVSEKPMGFRSAKKYKQSPMETLYLKILQHEYRSHMTDILKINDAQIKANYHRSPEFIGEMTPLYDSSIDIGKVEAYIKDETYRIAKYVYLKEETTKEERRNIRKCSNKVLRFLEFCIQARPDIREECILTELQIISCLQAILLDRLYQKENALDQETFDYAFHSKSTHTQAVYGALAEHKNVHVALQMYWVRKSVDHWYANVGRIELRENLRKLENLCDKQLLKILSCHSVVDMYEWHEHYFNPLFALLMGTILPDKEQK